MGCNGSPTVQLIQSVRDAVVVAVGGGGGSLWAISKSSPNNSLPRLTVIPLTSFSFFSFLFSLLFFYLQDEKKKL